MKLKDYSEAWEDTEAFHDLTNLKFEGFVNSDEKLKEHRDFVENHVYGFGERSFQWLHKLIVDKMPKEFSFIEVGVFKGQILSLYGILAERTERKCVRYGVTPLNTAGGVWESDYAKDIEFIHDKFNISKDYTILKGYSSDEKIVKQAKTNAPYDVVYIDGSHTYEDALFDLSTYGEMIKEGGFLIIDDCNNNLKMPFGYFQGIQTVTDAKLEWIKNNDKFKFIFSVVHISVFRKNVTQN